MPSSYNNSPEGNIDKLVRQLGATTTDAPETALSNAVRFNILFNDDYRHSGYQGRNAPKYDRETEQRNISRLSRDYREAKPEDRASTTLGKAIGDTRMYGSLAALDTNLSNMLVDSRRTLAKLHGSMFAGNVEGSDDNLYSADTVFKYIYADNMDGTRPVSERLTGRNFEDVADEGGEELLRFMADTRISWLVNTDIMGVQQSVSNSVSEIERIVNPRGYAGKGFIGARKLMDATGINRDTGKMSNISEATRVAKRRQATQLYKAMEKDIFLSDGGGHSSYIVNRIGTLPFIYLIEQAQTEIVIDTFQFQNKTVSDYLFDSIERKVLQNPDFKVTFRLAAPRDNQGKPAGDPKSYDILGPNILQIQKFGELQARLKEKYPHLKDKTIIDFQTQDKKHHPKLYYTDQVAAIGTANLTSPIGTSVHQAGSNFETMTFFFNRLGNGDREALNKNTADARATLMFQQVRELKELKEKENVRKGLDPTLVSPKFNARRGNIGQTGDIYEHLTDTIDFFEQKNPSGLRNRDTIGQDGHAKYNLFMILDQPMILQMDKAIYQGKGGALGGEMGEFTEEEQKTTSIYDSAHHKRYRQYQTKLFNLIAENRAFITVDAKNYNEQILNPLIEGIMSDDQSARHFMEHDADLRRLVGTGSLAERHSRLERMGFKSESRRLQMIGIASGNIHMASVPRQHAKGLALMERLFKPSGETYMHTLSYANVSSNYGPMGAPIRGDTKMDPFMNEEYGVTYLRHDIREQIEKLNSRAITGLSDYSLTAEQENSMLKEAGTHFMRTWTEFGNNQISSKRFREVPTAPMWENSVDYGALREFKTTLSKMAKKAGFSDTAFKIQYKSDSSTGKMSSIFLTMDVSGMAGMGSYGGSAGQLKFELTTLKSGRRGDPAQVLFIQQNKLVGESIFNNNQQGGGDGILMPFSTEGSLLHAGQSQKFNSMQTAVTLLGTLAGETVYRALNKAPIDYIRGMDDATRKSTILNYLTMTGMGIKSKDGAPLLESGQFSNILNLRQTLHHRFQPDALMYTNGAFKNAVLLSGDVPSDLQNSQNNRIGDTGLVKSRKAQQDTLAELLHELVMDSTSDVRKDRIVNIEIPKVFDKMLTLFPELAMDIVHTTADPLYYKELTLDNQGLQSTYLEPLKSTGQARMYGSAQRLYERTILGLGGTNADKATIRMMNLAQQYGTVEEGDLRNISTFSRYIPMAHGFGSNVGGTLIRSIAGGGTSSDDPNAPEFAFMKQSGRNFGTGYDMGIIEHLGVGSITTREQALGQIEEYKRRMGVTDNTPEVLGMMRNLDANFGDNKRLLTFYTSAPDWGKLSQLPQRLKNALGARPLYELSIGAQQIFERKQPGNTMVKFTNTYLKTKRKEAEKAIRKQQVPGGSLYGKSQNEIDVLLDGWFTEDFKIGALIGNRIRKVLADGSADFVEEIRGEVESVFGKDSTTERDGIASEVLRVRILQASLGTEGFGRMMGGSDRQGRQALAFIQLTGLYSDTAILNPEFGSVVNEKTGKVAVDGVMQAHMETLKKNFKSSMIGREGYQFKTKAGVSFIWDEASGRFVGYDKGVMIPDLMVGNSGATGAIANIAENKNYASNEPSISDIVQEVYKRRGQDSIEYLFDVGMRQPGMFETSQLQRMYRMLRIVRGVTSQRVEGTDSGALIKANPQYVSREANITPSLTGATSNMNYFQFLQWQISRNGWGGVFSATSKTGNVLNDTAIDNNADHTTSLNMRHTQISGVYGPSNLKSFFRSHGSMILRNPNMMNKLLGADGGAFDPEGGRLSQKAAASMIMGFGVDFMFNAKPEDVAAREAMQSNIKRTLVSAAAEGELGEYYKTFALAASALSNGDEAADFFIKKAGFNSVTTPWLAAISPEELLSALSGQDGGKFAKKLRKFVQLSDAAAKKEYIRLSTNPNDMVVQSSTIISQLDFVHQLSEQKYAVKIPNEIDYSNLSNLQKLKFLEGWTDEQVDRVGGEKAVVQLMMGMHSRVSGVLAHLDISAGAAKDPGGTKLQARTEYQQLVTPMLTQLKKFEQGGQVEGLSKVFANMMAVISGGTSTQFYNQDLTGHMSSYGLVDEYVHSPFFKRNMLGVYATGIASNQFTELESQYRDLTRLTEKKGKRGALIEAINKANDHKLTPQGKDYKAAMADVKYIYKKLAVIESKLQNVSREFAMYSNKSAGIDMARTIVGAMKHEGMTVAIPDFSLVDDEKGGFILKTNTKRGITTFIPSAKELQALGVSKGTYVEEFLDATIRLAQAFAPGTAVNDVLARAAAHPEGILLNETQAHEILKLEETGKRMPGLMAESMAGARAEAAEAVHLTYDGAVTTAVNSFLVPNGMFAMGQSYLDDAGMGVATAKINIMDAANRSFDETIEHIAGKTSEIDILRANRTTSMSAEEARAHYEALDVALPENHYRQLAHEDWTRAIDLEEGNLVRDLLYKKKQFIQGQMEALIVGTSFTGEEIYRRGTTASAKYKQIFDDAQKKTGIAKADAMMKLEGKIASELKIFQKDYGKGFFQAGDKFAQEAVIAEMDFWLAKAGLERDNATPNRTDQNTRILSSRKRLEYSTRVRLFEDVTMGVAGFEGIGSTSTNERIHASFMEGRYAGNLPQSYIDGSELKGIPPESQKTYLKKRLESMIEDIKYTAEDITIKIDDRYRRGRGITDNQVELLRPGIERAKKLADDLTILKSTIDNGSYTLEDVIAKIQVAVAQGDYLNLLSTTTWRPPPPGGMEHSSHQYALIQGVETMNKMSRENAERQGLPAMELDVKLGKAGSWLNPIGIQSIMGGDFDGDNYVTIFNYINDTKDDIRKIEGRLLATKMRVDKYKKTISEAVGDTTQLEVIVKDLEVSMASSKRKANLLQYKVERSREDMTSTGLERARKGFANYMGLDERMFMKDTDTGYQDPNKRVGYLEGRESVDVDALHTFLETGRELYPGMQDQASGVATLHSAMSQLLGLEMSTVGIVGGGDSSKLIQRAQNLATQGTDTPSHGLFKAIADQTDLGKNFTTSIRDELIKFSNTHEYRTAMASSDPAERDTALKREFNIFLGGDIYSKLGGQEKLANLVAMGSGASVSDNVYGLLQDSLGVAGSELLGKTYNTIIGTLYADSPTVALGHSVLGDKRTTNMVREHLNKVHADLTKENMGHLVEYEDAEGVKHQMTGDHFIGELTKSMSFSEGLQGYMKNVHQMLRDSIKLKKGDDTRQLLQQEQVKYAASTDENERKEILQRIAFNIGEGPGLRSLVRLDSLVNYEGIGITADKLAQEFGLHESDDPNSIYHLRKQRLIDAGVKVGGIDANSSPEDVRLAMARYQTSDDLIHTVTSYRVDKIKGAGDSIIDYFNLSRVKRFTERVTEKAFGHTSRDQVADAAESDAYLRKVYLGIGDDNPAGMSEYARHREAMAAQLGVTSPYDPESTAKLSSEYLDGVQEYMSTGSKARQGVGRLDEFNESYFQTVRQSRQFLGVYGQDLKRLSSYDKIRRSQAQIFVKGMGKDDDPDEVTRVYELMSGKTKEGQFDVIDTALRLMGQGKFNSKNMHDFAQTLHAQLSELDLTNGASVDDINRMMFHSDKLTTSQSSVAVNTMMTQFYKMIQGGEGQEAADITNQEMSLRVRDPHSADPDNLLTFQRGMAGYTDDALRETNTSGTGRLAANLVEANQEKKMKYRDFRDIAASQLEEGIAERVAGGMSDEDARTNYESDLMDLTRVLQHVHEMHTGQGATPANADMVRKGRAPLAGRLGNRSLSALKSYEGGNLIDFMIPVALTAVGQAVASGDIDPEANQQLIGATMTAMAYSRSSFARASTRASIGEGKKLGSFKGNDVHFTGISRTQLVAGAMGGTFKFGSALQSNDGDFGKAMMEVGVRELAFAASAAISPAIIDTVSSKLAGNFGQDGIHMGVNRTALDSDRFMASKTMAGSIVGAILSAGMGVFLGNMGAAVVRGRQLPGANIIDAALSGVEARIVNLQKQRQAALDSDENFDVTNAETGETIAVEIQLATSFYTDAPGDIDGDLYSTTDSYQSQPVNLFG